MATQRIISEDEKLARMLQMEEHNRAKNSGDFDKDSVSQQELEDAKLARQLADLDKKPAAQDLNQSYSSGEYMDSRTISSQSFGSPKRSTHYLGSDLTVGATLSPSPSRLPPHTRRPPAATSTTRTDRRSSNPHHRRIVSDHMDYAVGQKKPPPGSHPQLGEMNVPFANDHQHPPSPRRVSMHADYRAPSYAATASPHVFEDSAANERLELARRLQEQAFSDLERNGEQGRTSTEESDLELAIRLSEEEQRRVRTESIGVSDTAALPRTQQPQRVPVNSGEPSRRRKPQRVSLDDALGRDKTLVNFMAEAGASISDLSDGFLQDIMGSAEETGQEVNQDNNDRSHQRPLFQSGYGAVLGSQQCAPRETQPSPHPSSMREHSSNSIPIAPNRASVPSVRHVQPQPNSGSAVRSSSLMVGSSFPVSPASSTEHGSPQQPSNSIQQIQTTPVSARQQEAPMSPNSDDQKNKKGRRRRSLLGFGRNNREEIEGNPNIPGDIPGPPPCIPDPPSAPVGRPGPSRVPPAIPRAGGMPAGIPSRIPPSPGPRMMGSIPPNRVVPPPSHLISSPPPTVAGGRSMCAVCFKTTGPFLAAMGKKFHPGCFRCTGCRQQIDPYGQFRIKDDGRGGQKPYHTKCYVNACGGIVCSVCRQRIPASRSGQVEYVKHPFFDTELMCRKHAKNPGRVCSGCRKFEPVDKKFVELSDSNRCVCTTCSQTTIMNNRDVVPLWHDVLSFFEHHLKLPLFYEMTKVPILLVGLDQLDAQMGRSSPHYGSKQIMTSGLCLTDHQGRRVKLTSMEYHSSTSSFESMGHQREYEIPRVESNPSGVALSAILCLCGLPRILTASVLAHEALHAWLSVHPRAQHQRRLSAEVEEGCAQLVAMLYLMYDEQKKGSSELHEYYKFCIERDSTDVFGRGFKRAMKAYNNIGIEALLGYVIDYGDFPHT